MFSERSARWVVFLGGEKGGGKDIHKHERTWEEGFAWSEECIFVIKSKRETTQEMVVIVDDDA